MKSKSGRGTVHRISVQPHIDFHADTLTPGHDYDTVLFADRDFTGQDAADARFLDCRFERCGLDGVSMPRARLIDSVLVDVHGTSVNLADSIWRDCELSGGRLGAMTLAGCTWTRIRLSGVRLGFVNLAGARVEDVVFEECEIGSLDSRSAQLRSVTFGDCTVQELNVAEATLSKVDLSGARLRELIGIESLRGAVIGHDQLVDLAPLLAAQLGIEVRSA